MFNKSKLLLSLVVFNSGLLLAIMNVGNLSEIRTEANPNYALEFPDSTVVNWIYARLNNYNSLPVKYYNLEKTWSENIMTNDLFTPGKTITIDEIKDAEQILLPLGYWHKFATMWKIIGNGKHWNRTDGTKMIFKIVNRFWGASVGDIKTAIIDMEVTITKKKVTKTFRAISHNFLAHGLKTFVNVRQFLHFITELKASSLDVLTENTASEVFAKLQNAASDDEKSQILQALGWNKALTQTKPLRWKINYTPSTINQTNNNLDVDVEIFDVFSKHKIKNTFTLSGFKAEDSKDEEIVSEVKELITKKYEDVNLAQDSTWRNELPKRVKETFSEPLTNKQLQALNIDELNNEEMQGTTISYQIIDVDNDLGTALVAVKISKNKFMMSTSFNIKGFLTTAQHHEKIVTKIHNQMREINHLEQTNNVINLLKKSSYFTKLPSRVNLDEQDVLNDAQLKQLNLQLVSETEAQIIATVVKIDDGNGAMQVLMTITLGQAKKELLVTVRGFRKTDEQDQVDVDNLKYYLQDQYKNVKISDDSDDKKFLPSEMIEVLGENDLTPSKLERLEIPIVRPSILKKANITYQIDNFNNGNGQLSIKATIAQGKATADFVFYVKGYQTQNQRNQQEVDKALSKFLQANRDLKIASSDEMANKKVTELGYKVGSVLTTQQLKKINVIFNDNNNSLEWHFKIKVLDDETGSLTIEVMINQGFAEATGEVNVSGFLAAKNQ